MHSSGGQPWLKQALSLATWAMYVRGEALAVHRAISAGSGIDVQGRSLGTPGIIAGSA